MVNGLSHTLFSKNAQLLLIVIFCAAYMPSHCFATSQLSNSSAEISTAMSVTEQVGMNFGNVIANPAGDRIMLLTDGRVISTQGSLLNGTTNAAEFIVTGSPNAAINFSYSPLNYVTGPGQDIRLQSFRDNAGATPTLDGTGTLTFNIGGDLIVNPSQAVGIYFGTYTLSVDYQ